MHVSADNSLENNCFAAFKLPIYTFLTLRKCADNQSHVTMQHNFIIMFSIHFCNVLQECMQEWLTVTRKITVEKKKRERRKILIMLSTVPIIGQHFVWEDGKKKWESSKISWQKSYLASLGWGRSTQG